MRTHKESCLFHCPECDEANETLHPLKSHILRSHPMASQNKVSKEDKAPSWVELQVWACPKCPDQVQGMNEFIKHCHTAHSLENFLCPVCGKNSFLKKDHYRAHLLTHSDKKLPCEYCGRVFNDPNKRKRHVNEVHKGLKKHSCKTCGKTFSRLEKLRAHEPAHLEGGEAKPYLCDQCGRAFGRQEHVSRHKKICGKKQKRKEEPMDIHQCKQCHGKFLSSKDLKKHQREQPHLSKCNHCHLSFPSDGTLKDHNSVAHVNYWKGEAINLSNQVDSNNWCRKESDDPDLLEATVETSKKNFMEEGTNVIYNEGTGDIENEMMKSNSHLCLACGKAFKTKETREYHVRNTDLPGHGVVLDKLIKSQFAWVGITVSKKLSNKQKKDKDQLVLEPELAEVGKQSLDNSDEKPSQVLDPVTGYIYKGQGEAAFLPVEAAVKDESQTLIEPDLGNAVDLKKPQVPWTGAEFKVSPMGCLDCNLSFKDVNLLLDHFKNEPHKIDDSTMKSIECPIKSCNVTFTTLPRLVLHLKAGKHNQPCSECGKTFKRVFINTLKVLNVHINDFCFSWISLKFT